MPRNFLTAARQIVSKLRTVPSVRVKGDYGLGDLPSYRSRSCVFLLVRHVMCEGNYFRLPIPRKKEEA